MAELTVNVCPETGICSIGRGGTDKIDLMPDEVADIKDAADIDSVKAVIVDNDADFAGTLTTDDLTYIKRSVD